MAILSPTIIGGTFVHAIDLDITYDEAKKYVDYIEENENYDHENYFLIDVKIFKSTNGEKDWVDLQYKLMRKNYCVRLPRFKGVKNYD